MTQVPGLPRLSQRTPIIRASFPFYAVTHFQLITSDYVIDETLTLLRARGEAAKAVRLGQQLLENQVANVIFVTPTMVLMAWDLFRLQPSRPWSFTDCTSKIVMDELHVRRAMFLDHHFKEMGATDVLA